MRKIFALLLTIGLSTSAFALNWQMVGARSMGMGGAGVTTARGNYAQYYNPALLTVREEGNKANEFTAGLGFQGETSSAIFDVTKKLMDMSSQYKNLISHINSGAIASPEDLENFFTGITEINELLKNNTGALLNADVEFGIRFGHLGVSINSLGSVAASPAIDQKDILLNDGTGLTFGTNTTTVYTSLTTDLMTAIQNANIATDLQTVLGITGTYTEKQLADIMINTFLDNGYSYAQVKNAVEVMGSNMGSVAEFIQGVTPGNGIYSDNKTRVMAEMAAFSEAAVGYGFDIFHGVSLGANLKVIEGTTAQTGVFVLEEDAGFGGIIKDAWGNKKFSTNLGVDFGALVNFSDLFQGEVLFNPVIGFTAKNINSPKFKRPETPSGWALSWNSEDYKLKPQYRIGASVNPWKRVTIAVDLDLSKNETTLQDYKSQQLSAGVEILTANDIFFKLPVRFGVNKNLAESNAPMYLTAGFATIGRDVTFELAAAVGTGTEKVNGNNIPNAMALSMSFTTFF